MIGPKFCTECGEQLNGNDRFCTSCGNQTVSRTPEAPPSLGGASRRLVCVECGSPIDSGLVCARCAAQRASVRVRGDLRAASGNLPRTHQSFRLSGAAPSNVSPAVSRQATDDLPAKACPKCGVALQPGTTCVQCQRHLKISKWKTPALWLLGIYLLLVAWQVITKAPNYLPALSSLKTGLDGTYALEYRPDYNGVTARLTITGSQLTANMPDGSIGYGTVERVGETVRIVDFKDYLNGQLVPDLDPSRVELWSLTDNGQAILFTSGSEHLKFIKQ